MEHGSNTDFRRRTEVRVSSVFHPWLAPFPDLQSSRCAKKWVVIIRKAFFLLSLIPAFRDSLLCTCGALLNGHGQVGMMGGLGTGPLFEFPF
jgi:hypothetical protein